MAAASAPFGEVQNIQLPLPIAKDFARIQ